MMRKDVLLIFQDLYVLVLQCEDTLCMRGCKMNEFLITLLGSLALVRKDRIGEIMILLRTT